MSLAEETVQRAHPDYTKVQQKPHRIHQIGPAGWKYAFKRALSEFLADGCMDLAAALTYFAVLSIFPALLAVVSLLGVFGQGEQTKQAILDFLADYAPAEVLTLVSEPIAQLTSSSAANLALLTGLVGSLWTASGYVGAFGRSLNRIYGVVEGRPIWVLRPWNLLITAVLVLIVVLMLLVLLLSGSVLDFINEALPNLDLTGFTNIWMWFRWPVIFLLAVLLIALLYYGTPNVKQPKLRWISPGAFVALVVMALAGLGFSFYVSNFGKYNATYGTIAGVIVLLLFIWIMNCVLLLGAQIDAEIERSRELYAGIVAERSIQLQPRSQAQAAKLVEKKEKLIEQGRDIRLQHNGLDYARAVKTMDKNPR